MALPACHCRTACWEGPVQLSDQPLLPAVTAPAWASPELAKTVPATVAEGQSVPLLQAAGRAASSQPALTASALLDAAGANLPAQWSSLAAAAVSVLAHLLQLFDEPVSAAGEVAAPRSAGVAGVAVATRPAVAAVPVAVVPVAAAVAQQALAAAADWPGAVVV